MLSNKELVMIEHEDLLMYLTGSPDDWDYGEALDEFEERYGIEWDQAQPLISALIPLAMCAESPLTGKVYQGFAKDGLWLAKQPMHGNESK
jgi:hypothetical protein